MITLIILVSVLIASIVLFIVLCLLKAASKADEEYNKIRKSDGHVRNYDKSSQDDR